VLPLTISSFKHGQKMKAVQPQMKRLQELYKNDARRLNVEMMELYKRHGLRFMGLEGCLPVFIQMPVFFALYNALRSTYELRHAPWIGWIKDLSLHDPFYVLPVLMGAGMFFQQKMSMASMDPSQRQIMYIMPVMFTFFFLKMPSGLVLYWLTSSLLGIAGPTVPDEAARRRGGPAVNEWIGEGRTAEDAIARGLARLKLRLEQVEVQDARRTTERACSACSVFAGSKCAWWRNPAKARASTAAWTTSAATVATSAGTSAAVAGNGGTNARTASGIPRGPQKSERSARRPPRGRAAGKNRPPREERRPEREPREARKPAPPPRLPERRDAPAATAARGGARDPFGTMERPVWLGRSHLGNQIRGGGPGRVPFRTSRAAPHRRRGRPGPGSPGIPF
jgi:YidC/Oxa1 family membrane protein insertase